MFKTLLLFTFLAILVSQVTGTPIINSSTGIAQASIPVQIQEQENQTVENLEKRSPEPHYGKQIQGMQAQRSWLPPSHQFGVKGLYKRTYKYGGIGMQSQYGLHGRVPVYAKGHPGYQYAYGKGKPYY